MTNPREYMDFQTAKYDDLCGCVSILTPTNHNPFFTDGHGNEIVNHAATKSLIVHGEGSRIVCVNCEKCHGTGLMPPQPKGDK